MKKFTSLMLMLLCTVTAWAQSSLLVSEGLLATQENGQYKWTSEKMTKPEGATKLRVTFLQTSNNEKPAGFPCVAIAEFYLYDKDGNAVALTEANFSSNATHQGEGSMAAICDGVTTGAGNAYDWYWHSQWSDNPNPYGHHYLEIDLTDVAADLSEYSIGWITRRQQASPAEVVISTGATTEEAAQNFDTAYLTSLLTSNEEAPVYFTIRNIRNGDYCASYTRNDKNLALGSTKTKASIFYFTGAVEDGLATVKIHNYAADGVCMADFGSWTEDGINWYVQLSGNTAKRGYAISKENNLTTNISWNNDANRNNKVSAYNGNDVGSTFVFVKLSATEVQNIVNEFITGPENLVSGTSYRFRNLEGFNYMTGGDENVGTSNTAADNTAFAYYVSPNTGAKYLYNISSQKFIGTISTNTANIPLSATVTSSELTFKSSTNAIYPIMISTNNGGGSVNFNSDMGIINWQGGFSKTDNAGNSFSAEKVKVIDEETLATIQQLVGDYEFTIWKEQNLANLGRVGGYALDLQDEIEAITNYEQQVAFEAANEKIAINTNSYYRLVCVNPKDQTEDGVVISDDSYNTLTFNGKSNLVTAPSSASNINQIFKFEDAGNGYFYLKNMNADGYLNKIGVGAFRSAVVAQQEEACKVNVVSYANGYSNLTQYRLQNEGTALYSLFAENHPTDATAPYACSGWEDGANSPSAWYIVPATDIEVSINEFASIYLPFAVSVDGATAYAVEETTETSAIFAEKADIPANQGAILEGNGTATLTIISEATADWTNNMLKGSTVDAYLAGPAYVLSKPAESEIGFYKAALNRNEAGEEGTTHFKNNANKAYLVVENASPASLSFRFPGTTGIEEITDNRVQSTVIYDLTGRRVEAITAPGIYIVNGVKRVVR